jgi:carboxymethylenebutenolidase
VFDVPAVHARPDGMPRAGLVLHPDMGGLRPLFDDMARRIATYGIAVCAVEPFASVSPEERGTIEQRMAHVRDLDDRYQMEMLSSAADLLVVEDGVSRVGVLGFCMGGHYTFKAAAADRFDAAVAF